ncbi:PREDICTED: uncharacterized protein LOC107348111 isoform X2 [Acropora digitifera]|uniref:uncharacterized protein LOC107348111 isoform X2 n=1 Tax=Acropora digitifera TaxID=70779 RepID=UPI00077AA643|nr:PREDICTED: uncharacterized protein LOC107348111 isoform X2 [Acropora digitifera]
MVKYLRVPKTNKFNFLWRQNDELCHLPVPKKHRLLSIASNLGTRSQWTNGQEGNQKDRWCSDHLIKTEKYSTEEHSIFIDKNGQEKNLKDLCWSDYWTQTGNYLDANKPKRRTRRDDCISESLTFFIHGFNKSGRRTRMYY